MKRTIILFTLLMIIKVAHCQEKTIPLTTNQLKEDAGILKQALEKLHPGLYKFNTQKEIDLLFENLDKNISKSIQEKDFYLLLAKLTEKIACGHTYLNPWNLSENAANFYMPKNVFPFCFEVIKNKFIITHNLTDNDKINIGSEITKINGIPTKIIIDSLLQVSRSDGKNGIEKKISNIAIPAALANSYNLTDIFIPLFFKKTTNEFDFELKSPNNKRSAHKTSNFSLKDREEIFIIKYGRFPKTEDLLNIKMLNLETCYFEVGTFNVYGDNNILYKKIDSLFLSLKNNPQVENLIIDIRKTEGGNTEARDYLLKYLLPKNFDAKNYDEKVFHAFLEVPKNLLPYIYTWNEKYLEPKSTLLFSKNEFGLYQNNSANKDGSENISDFKIHENRFKGKIVLMSSPINSSVAYEVARIFQKYEAGIIVGEKTGGTKKGINGGRSFFVTLPNSKIEIDVPILYQAHEKEKDEGITPDYLIKKTQKDILENSDTQLKYVLKILKK